MIKVNVNGEAHDLEADIDDVVVDVLRDRLGLTGTKLTCGAGVCGTCTVLLDGEPVVGCLTPAVAVAGRHVETIESVAARSHPVVRAFAVHNALQCGFCTPGFVVEAAAFHDRWRAEHGPIEPCDADVAAALAGHLCRCGAYPEILAAVRAACAGDFDAGTGHDPEEPRGPRREAIEKVAGQALYTVDVRLGGQLEGLILRSPHAHARVVAVDLSAAMTVDGVHAAVDLTPDGGMVRYIGCEVAAVAAVDRRTAHAALRRIAVIYEPLPAVVGMAAARADGAPTVYATGSRRPPPAGERRPNPAPWRGNLHGPVGAFSTRRRVVRRLVRRARAAGDPLLVEGVFRAEAQQHTAFEPHAAVARWGGDSLEVYVSTQGVSHLAREIAKRFRLPEDKVRVHAEHVGGGFGAKQELGPEVVAAVELARAAGVPVRVVFDRLEELSVAGYRPAAEIELSLLTDREANLRALRVAAYADAGVAIGSSIAALARLTYPARAKELIDYDVVTNASPGSPFRGPGGPLTCFAVEQAVDEAARRLGRDPITLRQRWDPDPLRQRLYRWAAALPTWRERATLARTGRFRHGVGVAAANWFYFWQSGCEVELSVEDGRLVAATATQDIGTGSRSVLANVIAGAFGLDPSEVEIRLGDSRLAPGPRSGGSSTTATIVPAALDAAQRLKCQVAARLATPIRRTVIPTEGIQHEGTLLSWREAITHANGMRVVAGRPGDDRRLGRRAVAAFGGAGMIGRGYIWLLRLMLHLRTGRGYPGAVHVAEVEVDTRLGRTRVLKVHAGLAVGRPAAHELAASQARGAIIQGIGYALYEQREVDPHTGLVLTAGLEDYRIPGIADIPEIDLHFDPAGFEHVAGGGVGLGEVSTLPVAAAIANAVNDAIGARPYEIPIRPDRLLALIGGTP